MNISRLSHEGHSPKYKNLCEESKMEAVLFVFKLDYRYFRNFLVKVYQFIVGNKMINTSEMGWSLKCC